jgi:hypothetical protein
VWLEHFGYFAGRIQHQNRSHRQDKQVAGVDADPSALYC